MWVERPQDGEPNDTEQEQGSTHQTGLPSASDWQPTLEALRRPKHQRSPADYVARDHGRARETGLDEPPQEDAGERPDSRQNNSPPTVAMVLAPNSCPASRSRTPSGYQRSSIRWSRWSTPWRAVCVNIVTSWWSAPKTVVSTAPNTVGLAGLTAGLFVWGCRPWFSLRLWLSPEPRVEYEQARQQQDAGEERETNRDARYEAEPLQRRDQREHQHTEASNRRGRTGEQRAAGPADGSGECLDGFSAALAPP